MRETSAKSPHFRRGARVTRRSVTLPAPNLFKYGRATSRHHFQYLHQKLEESADLVTRTETVYTVRETSATFKTIFDFSFFGSISKTIIMGTIR